MQLDIHTIYFVFALFNLFSFIFFTTYKLLLKEKSKAVFFYMLSNAAMCIQWLLYAIRPFIVSNWTIIFSNVMGILGIVYVLYSLYLTLTTFNMRTFILVTLFAIALGITHGVFVNQAEYFRIVLYSFFLAGILLSGTLYFLIKQKKNKLYFISAITMLMASVSLVIRGLYALFYNQDVQMNQSGWYNTVPANLYFVFYYFMAIIILLILKEQYSMTIKSDNKELQQVNATKNKIMSVMAHDLRNNFNAILGFSNLLKENEFDLTSGEGKQYINILNQQAEETNNLLESLLTWTRTQSNQIVYLPEDIDLNHIATDVLDSLKNLANLKNIAISFSILGADKIYADKNMLCTILRNLISNSIKFTPQKGQIDLTIIERLNSFEFMVKDNGMGLNEKALKTLFNTQMNKSTEGTNHEKGTGLGLMLCKEFVVKHGGKIWVNSTLGKGSEFIFTIPKVS